MVLEADIMSGDRVCVWDDDALSVKDSVVVSDVGVPEMPKEYETNMDFDRLATRV